MSHVDAVSEVASTLREAGAAARVLAVALASQVFESDLPASHWDELIEQLAELLGQGRQPGGDAGPGASG
jgi:hypothetical protein